MSAPIRNAPIGLMIDRHPQLLTGMLGILKSGSGFLPIDPSLPGERIKVLLNDCQVKILVTQGRDVEKAHEVAVSSSVKHIICLDPLPSTLSSDGVTLHDAADLTRQRAHPPGDLVGADSLAYVIYTSGSTGRPKGVPITHRNLCPVMHWARRYFKLDADTRALQNLNHCFDFGIFELLTTLVSGGTLFCIDPIKRDQSGGYVEYIHQEHCNTLHCTPSFLQRLIPYCDELNSLRVLHLGGESLTHAVVDEVNQKVASGCTVYNGYGPTEATINCAVFRLADRASSKDVTSTASIPIGKPTANHRVVILDVCGELAPVEVPGEICVGGESLTYGYIGDPALTATKLVPDSWSGEPGSRIYRTGDLARYLSDGNIEFLGRIDHQVKINGFRIELEEVEWALRSLPAVKEVAVQPRKDKTGNDQLVGFVVAADGVQVMPALLRKALKPILPTYMIPSSFVPLESVPRNSNGKIDRRKLLAHEIVGAANPQPTLAPRNHVELEMAQLWEEVLAVRPVGVRDNFFDLGGHSLLALHLTGQIRQRFNTDLPLAALIEAGTVEKVVRLVRRQNGPSPRRTLVPIERSGEKPPFFCVHGVGGEVLNFVALARRLGPEQPFYGIQGLGPDEIDGHAPSIEQMAASYLAEVQSAQPEGPYIIGGLCYGGVVAFEMAQQLVRRGHEVAVLALLDAFSPTFLPRYPDSAHLLVDQAQYHARLKGNELPVSPADLQRLKPAEQLDYLLDVIKEAELVPSELGLDWLRRYAQGYKARIEAFFEYVPQPYPGRITLLRARDREPTLVQRFKQRGIDICDETHGWGSLSREPLESYDVPGMHETICHEPHVKVLAERLGECFGRALSLCPT